MKASIRVTDSKSMLYRTRNIKTSARILGLVRCAGCTRTLTASEQNRNAIYCGSCWHVDCKE